MKTPPTSWTASSAQKAKRYYITVPLRWHFSFAHGRQMGGKKKTPARASLQSKGESLKDLGITIQEILDGNSLYQESLAKLTGSREFGASVIPSASPCLANRSRKSPAIFPSWAFLPGNLPQFIPQLVAMPPCRRPSLTGNVALAALLPPK